MGVEHTTKFLHALTHLVVEAIGLAKNGVGLSTYRQGLSMLAQMRVLVLEAKESLPELKDLDTDEAVELGHVAYKCVARIVAAAG